MTLQLGEIAPDFTVESIDGAEHFGSPAKNLFTTT